MTEKIEAEKSSGNVFADLGLPDAEEYLVKANIAILIADAIKKRGLTQDAAAEILGVDQPRVSDVVRGRLGRFSIDKLFRFLIALRLRIEINIAPQTARAKPNIIVIGKPIRAVTKKKRAKKKKTGRRVVKKTAKKRGAVRRTKRKGRAKVSAPA